MKYKNLLIEGNTTDLLVEDSDASHDISCKFCNIYNASAVRAIPDTILYESKYFFVIPALGSLVKNYIMVISKRHIHSMCYLKDSEKKELLFILNQFRTMLKEQYGFYPIIFEHGASSIDTNRSACCVLHAHLHIVPYTIIRQSEMLETLNLAPLNDFSEFFTSGYDNPYIFFMDNQGGLYFKNCKKDVVPSQIIRKWIAADMGCSDAWDWRDKQFLDNISDTVADLKPLIKKSINNVDYRLKYVYYCRAMDGLDTVAIEKEYNYVQQRLLEQGRVLVNPYVKSEHRRLKFNKINSELIVTENLRGMSKADCVIVNLSMKGHTYVGCIAEMVYAKEKGCYVIVISGDTGVEKHFYTIYHADKIVRNLDELFDSSDWRKRN